MGLEEVIHGVTSITQLVGCILDSRQANLSFSRDSRTQSMEYIFSRCDGVVSMWSRLLKGYPLFWFNKLAFVRTRMDL